MSHVGIVGVRGVAAAPAAEETTAPEATDAQARIAKEHPAGIVQVERSGLKLGGQIAGGVLGVAGAAVLGISLLTGRGGGVESRLRMAPLLLGGGLVAGGAAAAFGQELLPTKRVVAAATKIPTRAEAQEIANTMADRRTEVVRDEATGTFAVIDKGPMASGYVPRGDSYGGGYGHYHGSHYHDHHHYSGDHHYHDGGYTGPWLPDYSDHYPDPHYPSPGSYPTSPGDDFGYDWEPYVPPSHGGGTSSGDDHDYGGGWGSGGTSSGDDGGSSYVPPAYNPPAYNPPSYDPPSYGGGSSGGYGGNSTSNGNPSYDDF